MLIPTSPFFKCLYLVVLVPGHVDADGVALNLAVVRVVRGHGVEELAPDELAADGVARRWVTLVHLYA